VDGLGFYDLADGDGDVDGDDVLQYDNDV
jgi:hypothetical protein